MIPAFNHSHVLPPFMGQSHTSANASPYAVTATELVIRFATTPERIQLLQGLFRYRNALQDLGFVQGFQWLDGSFVENVEAHENRAPNDVDVVTFVQPPAGMTSPEIKVMLQKNLEIFDRAQCKAQFFCDPFLVQLNKPAERLIHETTFWHSFFSHRRSDQVWKGLLQLSLASDDDAAQAKLDRIQNGEGHVATT